MLLEVYIQELKLCFAPMAQIDRVWSDLRIDKIDGKKKFFFSSFSPGYTALFRQFIEIYFFFFGRPVDVESLNSANEVLFV